MARLILKSAASFTLIGLLIIIPSHTAIGLRNRDGPRHDQNHIRSRHGGSRRGQNSGNNNNNNNNNNNPANKVRMLAIQPSFLGGGQFGDGSMFVDNEATSAAANGIVLNRPTVPGGSSMTAPTSIQMAPNFIALPGLGANVGKNMISSMSWPFSPPSAPPSRPPMRPPPSYFQQSPMQIINVPSPSNYATGGGGGPGMSNQFQVIPSLFSSGSSSMGGYQIVPSPAFTQQSQPRFQVIQTNNLEQFHHQRMPQPLRVVPSNYMQSEPESMNQHHASPPAGHFITIMQSPPSSSSSSSSGSSSSQPSHSSSMLPGWVSAVPQFHNTLPAGMMVFGLPDIDIPVPQQQAMSNYMGFSPREADASSNPTNVGDAELLAAFIVPFSAPGSPYSSYSSSGAYQQQHHHDPTANKVATLTCNGQTYTVNSEDARMLSCCGYRTYQWASEKCIDGVVFPLKEGRRDEQPLMFPAQTPDESDK